MARRSLSVTVSLPIEMDEKIGEEADKHGMSYSEYVRQALRESMGTPFECDDTVLCVDENVRKAREEGAA
jgi:Arc/MetJ-type ribon-helix-helix transcriptional regulator